MTTLDEGKWPWGTCPHSYSGQLWHCPLYIESHDTRQLGCIDDLARPCMVERGELRFDKAYDKLIGAHSVVQFARTIAALVDQQEKG